MKLLFFAALLPVMVACAPTIGDKCERSSQCGTTLSCDTTIAQGYCLKVGCRQGECPAEAACIDFGGDTRFCMRHCAVDNECRDDLLCRPVPLCSDVSAASAPAPCSMEKSQLFCGSK
ncbi:MAG: hypothetical protein EXR77_17775 [Myxococcales bacterium]|nr:hypothetical protein [Myxococcales bacterium]